MRGDGRVLHIRNRRDVDERIRPQWRAHFVESDARYGQIGEKRGIAGDEIAERSRERGMVRMNLDRAGDGDEVRLPFAQNRSETFIEILRIFQSPIGESEELDRGVAEEREGGARLLFTLRGVAGLRTIRGDDHMHGAALAQVQRYQTAAADDLVIRMRRKHEQALAA
jgi:hypothetical protein